jgi:phage major head subunit gpT-like protein
MIINDSGLSQLNQRYNILFENSVKGAAFDWMKLAVETTSVTKTEHYPVSGASPKMREWLGERQAKNLSNYDLSITNKKYESTVEVAVEDVEDDRYGIYDSQIRDMGTQAGLLPQDLLLDLIINGQTHTCYDGQYFFDSDHPVNPRNSSAGTQSNVLTSSALAKATFQTAKTQMATLKDENGTVIGTSGNLLLVVPSVLETTAKELCYGDYISVASGSTQSNVQKGSASVLVMPQLDGTSATTWYIFDVGRAAKPFIIQKRAAPVMQNPTMAAFVQFMKDKLIYGARARYGAGYNLWQLGIKVTA